MSFLLWQRESDTRIASPRLVLRAAEVPLLQQAHALRDRLEQLHREQQEIVAAAAAEACEQARAAGLDEGRRAAAEELATRLQALAHDTQAERERLRNQIGALALQVVRKLLGTFAADEVLLALADTACAELLPAQPLALVVHPERCDAVRQRLAGNAGALRCDVRADAACAPDGCRLETEHGSVDVALEAQLARLEAAWCKPIAGTPHER